MEKKKKKWIEPKLTVLVRRKPEEGILGACKAESLWTGAGSVHGGCFKIDASSPTPCPECSAVSFT